MQALELKLVKLERWEKCGRVPGGVKSTVRDGREYSSKIKGWGSSTGVYVSTDTHPAAVILASQQQPLPTRDLSVSRVIQLEIMMAIPSFHNSLSQ